MVNRVRDYLPRVRHDPPHPPAPETETPGALTVALAVVVVLAAGVVLLACLGER